MAIDRNTTLVATYFDGRYPLAHGMNIGDPRKLLWVG